IYQGAVNEGRSFETLIPAFQWIDCPIRIYGDGNFMDKAIALTRQYKLESKIIFKGKLTPAELIYITPQALLGITLFEKQGLSNYYSLANRFFDYIHAGIPQICADYPVYKQINDEFEVAVLVPDMSPESIATAINKLLNNAPLQNKLSNNCYPARQIYNWQNEEKKLIRFYHNLFSIE
ncbi:MAG TPA: glycosyltransferase, partial [Flavisolibacter sp.]|nr:glycosyltransferase [Flavisolibacter sp.]